MNEKFARIYCNQIGNSECLICVAFNQSIIGVDVVLKLECGGKISGVFFVKSIVVFEKNYVWNYEEKMWLEEF